MELRPLSTVDFTTQRHDHPSRPVPFSAGGGVTSASAAVRLRHTRLRLLNEIDAAAPDDAPSEAASTSTSAAARQPAPSADWRDANRRRREVLAEFRRRAALTLRQRMPVVRDVNKIDRYSRTAFPVLFIIFNVAYWVYYLAHKRSHMID